MRIRKSKLGIDMFPFLSVLCAVIGVLMLFLLLTISSRIVVDSSARAPDIFAAGPGDASTPLTEQELTRLREELAHLAAKVADQQSSLEEVQQRRDDLRELLALKQEQRHFAYGDGRFAGVELSSEVTVFMKPADDVRVAKRPRFVEVGLSGYTVYPERERYSVNDLPRREQPVTIDHQPSTPLERFFQRADRQRDTEYLVFLIRPSGCEAFDRAKQYLVRRYPHPQTNSLSRIDIGWEPFAPEWLLALENTNSP